MTPKQILDSFSEVLMQDERILSPQERTLLRNLLRHAEAASLEPSLHAAVNATIASAVGETVAQRAFSVLGMSIVERIVGGSDASAALEGVGPRIRAGGTPQPPVPAPPPPAPPHDAPIEPPAPPHASPGSADMRLLQPTGMVAQRATSGKTAVLKPGEYPAPKCVVLDEFLAPQEVQELTNFCLEHEAEFSVSQVVPQHLQESLINEQHRRSLVLINPGKYRDLMLARIRPALPLVLSRLGTEEFSISNFETQITASNDGDFFRCHRDNGHANVASRELTFVYFFHREPRPFSGGELRIHNRRMDGNQQVSTESYETIIPEQNQIVFFPCSAMHEITPVKCPSVKFADSRFTLNGWLHK